MANCKMCKTNHMAKHGGTFCFWKLLLTEVCKNSLHSSCLYLFVLTYNFYNVFWNHSLFFSSHFLFTTQWWDVMLWQNLPIFPVVWKKPKSICINQMEVCSQASIKAYYSQLTCWYHHIIIVVTVIITH